MSEVGQILWFSLLVSERQTGIIKRSHTCRWQSGKEPRSPDTWSPINFRFPEAFPQTTHSGQTASTIWHCAVLTGSTKSLSNFHDCVFFSVVPWYIFQCHLILKHRGIKSAASFHCMCQLCGDSNATCTFLLPYFLPQQQKWCTCQFP